MGKVLTFLGASLALALVVPAAAQVANPFQDVPRDHWAYEAVESLRSKGILIGYPDGYFRGKRTLTRYELAVALDRALKSIPATAGERGPAGETGPAGPAGPQGEQGPPGMTPEEVQNLRRLAEEFRNELTALGNNMAAVNRRLDALAKDVEDIKAQLSKMPKIGGGAWMGMRADRASGGYVDKDGRVNGITPPGATGSGLTSTPVILHDFRLGVDANLAGGATLSAAVSSNNYKNYLGSLAVVSPLLNTNPGSDFYVDLLEVRTPLGGLGRDSNLTIGRFAHRISHLTLWKPDVDTYFNVPWVDDGNYRMDGARLTTNFGSLAVEAFGAQTKSVQGIGVTGLGFNSPLAGASPANGPALFVGGQKPIGQPYQGQMMVDQLVGVSLGLGIRQFEGGHVRFTAMDTSAKTSPSMGAGFNNVYVLGADADMKIAERVVVNADWAKTITGQGRFDTVNPHENNAFTAALGYQSAGLSLNAGYRYVDPLFYSPGYWGRIGNWINPTNVQGPTVRAAYDFSPAFGLTAGGDFYSAARNRAAQGGLSTNDDITRVLVGLRWDLSKSFRTTVDWEGVYWKFGAGSAIGNATTVHPTEHYITIGTGLNLTENTILKLMYQIGDFNGKGALGGGVPGLGNYSFNTLTGQVAVKF